MVVSSNNEIVTILVLSLLKIGYVPLSIPSSPRMHKILKVAKYISKVWNYFLKLSKNNSKL